MRRRLQRWLRRLARESGESGVYSCTFYSEAALASSAGALAGGRRGVPEDCSYCSAVTTLLLPACPAHHISTSPLPPTTHTSQYAIKQQ